MYTPVEHEHYGDNSSCRYDIAPIVDDDIAGNYFKWHKSSLEDKEVVPCRHAEGFVDVTSCESDER